MTVFNLKNELSLESAQCPFLETYNSHTSLYKMAHSNVGPVFWDQRSKLRQNSTWCQYYKYKT